MCLIIETKKSIPISKDLMVEFASRNDDGFGFMFIKNDVIQIEKYVDQSVDLLFERYEALKEFEPIIHLRMKTHGLIDHTNTHPYPVCRGIFLMHNGVFSTGNAGDTDKSDTWHFIEDYIKPMLEVSKNAHEFMRTKAFRGIMEKLMGNGQRVVMGDKLGYVFFNEPAWHTITEATTGAEGLRVSNTYAWNEGYNRPKVITQPARHRTIGSGGSGNLGSATRFSAYGMIEIDTDLYADAEGQIWEKNGAKYTCDGNISKSKQKRTRKRYARTMLKYEREAERRKKEEGSLVITVKPHLVVVEPPKVEVPAILQRGTSDMVCLPGTEPVFDTEDPGENDEHCEIILPTDPLKNEYEAFYYDGLEKEWARLPLWALATIMSEEPDEAARLLHRRLRNV